VQKSSSRQSFGSVPTHAAAEQQAWEIAESGE
jgi:hypothetical protein